MISVAACDTREIRTFYWNPKPPTEFLARGIEVDVAWRGGTRIMATRELVRGPARRRHGRAHPVQTP